MSGLFNDDFLVSSEEYSSVLHKTVLPELSARRNDRTVYGKDGFPLFCSGFHADEPRGTVFILHGFTENSYKYSELIYSLVQNHFSVVAYDQRGHGCSGRDAGLSHSSVTHVDRFESYVEDFSVICDAFSDASPKPWLLFAHSMGGAVAALFLEQHPSVFSAAALCAPMIAPATGGLSPLAASAAARILCFFGQSRSNPFFMKTYSGPEVFESSCATDYQRFSWYDAEKARNESYQNSTPSCRWIVESIAVTRKILAPGAPETIRCPVLLSAADKDTSVRPDAQKQFIRRVPHGRYLFVENSRHEIYRSVNSVFFPWWHQILSFFEEVAE